MLWLRTHPFALLFAGAGLVLLIMFISIQGTSTPPTRGGPVVAIGGGNTLENPGISERYPSIDAPSSNPERQPSAVNPIIPLSPQSTTSPRTPAPTLAQTQTAGEDGQEIDLSMFFSNETPLPASQPDTGLADQLLKEAYSLVPSTFWPVAKPAVRTPEQKTLYVYGNRAGLAVLSFQNAHANMATVLTGWFEDRSNETYKGASIDIAEDMIALGDTLSTLGGVPASAAAANENLAASYRDAGGKLLEVITSGGSEDALVASMQTYNSSVEDFTRNYISLVDLFSKNGVIFSASDTGSAFSIPR